MLSASAMFPFFCFKSNVMTKDPLLKMGCSSLYSMWFLSESVVGDGLSSAVEGSQPVGCDR